MAEDIQTATRGTNEDATRPEGEQASPEPIKITMDKRIDLAMAVGMILVGVFEIIAARNIRAGSIPDPITSQGLANITGTLLIILGIILAALRLVTWSTLPGKFVPEEGQSDEEGHPASGIRAVTIVVAGLLWVWLLRPLGYLIVTALFLFAIELCMGIRTRGKLIAFPLVFAVLTWFLFSQILNVILPLGPLTSFARSLGLTP